MDNTTMEDFNLDDDLFKEEDNASKDIPQTKTRDLGFFQNLPVQITLALASAEMTIGDLTKMGNGDVISLDRMIDEPLDLLVNGKLIAKCEVVDVNGRYGVKLVEVETSGIANI